MYDFELIAKTVAILSFAGIKEVENPTEYFTYGASIGSISNYKKIKLSQIKSVLDPIGNAHLAVKVFYESFSESGEDLCDSHLTESRHVKLEDLPSYLRDKGFVPNNR